MPERSSASELRAALEDALGGGVQESFVERGIRLSAPAPEASDWDRWRKVIGVMSAADAWGSSSLTGTPVVWAEVNDA